MSEDVDDALVPQRHGRRQGHACQTQTPVENYNRTRDDPLDLPSVVMPPYKVGFPHQIDRILYGNRSFDDVEGPSKQRVQPSVNGTVKISLRVRESVMIPSMNCNPYNRRTMTSHASEEKKDVLFPPRQLMSLVRKNPMVPNSHAQSVHQGPHDQRAY